MSELREKIQATIASEPVVVFIKGTPDSPMCGNSDRAMNALRLLEAPFTAVDILPDPAIRQELSALSGWPTIPQVFVKGELVGGADIVAEMYETGELSTVLGLEAPEDAPAEAPAAEVEPSVPPLQIENRLA